MKLPIILQAMALSLSSLVSHVGAATVQVATCSDWETAVNATLIENTTAVITTSSFSYDDCGESSFKTFEVKNNLLKVEPDVAWRKLCRFWSIRFRVTDNGQLSFSISADFNMSGDKELEVDGGFIYIENGSTARFLKDLEVTGFHVMCTRNEDYCSDVFDGGYVWNEGYFRVNGHATFTDCDNDKTHDACPGLGGAIYNGPDGSTFSRVESPSRTCTLMISATTTPPSTTRGRLISRATLRFWISQPTISTRQRPAPPSTTKRMLRSPSRRMPRPLSSIA